MHIDRKLLEVLSSHNVYFLQVFLLVECKAIWAVRLCDWDSIRIRWVLLQPGELWSLLLQQWCELVPFLPRKLHLLHRL